MVAALAATFGPLPMPGPGAAQAPDLSSAPPFDARLVRASVPEAIPLSGEPVAVAVRTRRPVSRLRVTLNSERAGGVRAERLGRLRWRVLLPAQKLRRGANRVAIRARADGLRGLAIARFRYLHPARGLVRVPRPARGAVASGALPVELSAHRRARVRASLNGRPLDAELGLAHRVRVGGRTVVRFDLGAGHGLRFGLNRLVVEADLGGAYTRLVRRVRVSRDAPLAAAGLSRTVARRRAVRLDARAARAAGGGPVRLRWRVAAAPPGSRARPSDPTGARPWFRPDRPGVYRLELTARDRAGVSGSESVTVSATQGPIVPVVTEAVQGGRVGIQLGGVFFAAPAAPVQVFVLDRSTLAPPPTVRGFSDLTQIGPFITAQQAQLGSPIVIVQTTTQGAVSAGGAADLNAALGRIGARPAWTSQPSIPAPAVAVGVAGASAGAATQSCAGFPRSTSRRCAIDGFFTSPGGDDSHYAFSSGDYAEFATRPAAPPSGLANTMTVAGSDMVAPPFPAGSLGGYHVVVLDRYTLGVVANEVFATGDPGSGPAQQAMAARLQGVVADSTQMVMIASVGQPVSAASRDPAQWTAVMNGIGALGGTPDVFARVQGAGTYSFVGISTDVDYGRVAESASVVQPPGAAARTGVLRGMLERSRSSLYQPLATSGGAPQAALFQALFGPPTAWPDSGRADYAVASAWFAGRLLPDLGYADVRDAYGDLSAVGSWADVESRLALQTYPGPGAGFSKATFDALVADYGGTATADGEFDLVDQVNQFLTSTVQRPFTDSSLPDFESVTNMAADIQAAVKPPAASLATTDLLAILQGALDVATADVPEELDPAASALSGLFGIASGATDDADSGDPIATQVQAAVADLGSEITSRETEILETFDTIAAIAVTDYGRLTRMGQLVGSLRWGAPTSAAVNNDLQAGTRQEIARTLLPAAQWTIPTREFDPGVPALWYTATTDITNEADSGAPRVPLSNVIDWYCIEIFDKIHPYNRMDPNAQYGSILAWADAATPLYSVFFPVAATGAGDSNSGDDTRQCSFHWRPTQLGAASVFDALFAAPGAAVPGSPLKGIGFYPPWFWWRYGTGATCWRSPQQGCGPALAPAYIPAPVWQG